MTSDDTPRGPARSERADVRRNRARLLAAAREMFLRDGAGASLEGVARQAGVGIGTLYRHFPTRRDLLEALLSDVYDELGARARELADAADDPGAALMVWLRAFVSQVTAFRGMAASALVTLRDEAAEPPASCRTMRAAGEALFARAQRAGDVPADTEFLDVLTLAGAIAMAAEEDPGTADRLLSLAAAGAVPGAGASAGGEPGASA